MKKKARIVFMGTPEFAVPALEALHKNGQHIILVVTQPDRPKGRGRKVVPTPVKAAAIRLGCDVIQPSSIRTDEFSDRMAQLKPDMTVVVAYGRIIPKNILSLPKLGTINVHASLLPKYRGPAPINWAMSARLFGRSAQPGQANRPPMSVVKRTCSCPSVGSAAATAIWWWPTATPVWTGRGSTPPRGRSRG